MRWLFASLLLCAAARAQGEAAQDRARREFDDGEAAYRLGRFEEAARHYEESYRLSRIPVILFNIGQACRKAFGAGGKVEHARRALEVYKAFLRDDPKTSRRAEVERFVRDLDEKLGDAERADLRRRIAEAKGLAACRHSKLRNSSGDRPASLSKAASSPFLSARPAWAGTESVTRPLSRMT